MITNLTNTIQAANKKLLLLLLVCCCSLSTFAQEEEDKESTTGGFKKELLFTGGTINLSFFNGATVLGASPQLGYSVTQWLDAGVIFGFTYSSQRDNFNNKFRQTIIGPGAFVRIFPVNFLFISAQFEHNFIKQKYLYSTGGSEVNNRDVSSMLVGAGYCSGREGRNTPYYYFSVSVDMLNNRNSPYTDQYNNLLPVVNAGFNIPLFQGNQRKNRY
jgi:hypothetical protein